MTMIKFSNNAPEDADDLYKYVFDKGTEIAPTHLLVKFSSKMKGDRAQREEQDINEELL